MSLDAAKCLYTGLVTDTGSFRFPSVSAHTHAVVAALLHSGLNHAEVHESTFDDQSLSRVQLHGFALSERLKIWDEAGIGVIALDLEDLNRFQYVSGDTEGLVNRILGIRGVQMAIFMRESDPGKVKMSLRSKGGLDVQSLASQYFDGGGHTNAAGGVLLGMSMADAKAKVDEALDEWIRS
jgi:phosphoesterase RecJ-like protein